MTWQRYSRIVDQLILQINRATGVLDARLGRRISNLNKHLAQRKAWRNSSFRTAPYTPVT